MSHPAERTDEAQQLFDKTGRPIEVGDILKVFHFVGRRWRKRYYMYKQVLGVCCLKEGSRERYLKIGHLTFDESEHYWQHLDGRMLTDYEIVQSIKADFQDRPRICPAPGEVA